MRRFILDSVADSRENLRAAGSDIIVRIGKPEEASFKRVVPPQFRNILSVANMDIKPALSTVDFPVTDCKSDSKINDCKLTDYHY